MSANLVGVGSASAASLGATLSMASSGSAVTAGTKLVITSSSYEANEDVGFWINVPDGTVVSPDSLGQDNTEIVDGVIPLNDMGSADADGNLSYAVDTSGLPDGDYSLVAHGLSTGREGVIDFTIMNGPPAPLTGSDNASVTAGTPLTISGASYEADEAIALWINVPDGASIDANSLGQDNTEVVDGVIGLNEMGSADDNGAFTYTLDTTGLPSGTYSLVAHGLASGLEKVLIFTIQ
jgi:hypothetical protein